MFTLAWVLLACFAAIQADDAATPAVQYKSPVPAGNAFLAEHFDNEDAFHDKWEQSKSQKQDGSQYDGEFQIQGSSAEDRLKGDLGMVLKTKARHHAISAALSRPFIFDHRPLIVQYEVQFLNGMECGGAYLKLLSQPESGKTTSDVQTHFNDKTRYSVMFGPDKCGSQYKLQLIVQHKNPKTGEFEEKHWTNIVNAGGALGGRFSEVFTDKKSHLYTLILSPDNKFEVQIDGRTEARGNLLEDLDPPINPPKEIEDANDKKPEDWDEREKIPDPDATKPEDWDEDEPKEITDPKAEKPIGWLDDEPALIPDPEASRPADWDEDMDGVWEAPVVDNPKCKDVGCGEWKPPMIANPKYKGKWRAPTIDNPAYKGKWRPRKIPNPDYFEDLHPFRLQPVVAVGFELWSMTDGIVFDNLLVTDDKAVATQWSEDSFQTKRRLFDKSGRSFFDSTFATFVDYSTQYPWLWAVYTLVIGIPVALLISYCCMSKTTVDDEPARRKKADLEEEEEPLVTEDDQVEEDQANASDDVDEAGDTARNQSADEAKEDEGTGAKPAARRRKVRKE